MMRVSTASVVCICIFALSTPIVAQKCKAKRGRVSNRWCKLNCDRAASTNTATTTTVAVEPCRDTNRKYCSKKANVNKCKKAWFETKCCGTCTEILGGGSDGSKGGSCSSSCSHQCNEWCSCNRNSNSCEDYNRRECRKIKLWGRCDARDMIKCPVACSAPWCNGRRLTFMV